MKFDTVINGEDYTVTFEVSGRGREAEVEDITICQLGTETEVEGVYECLNGAEQSQLVSEAWEAYDKYCAEARDEGDYS